MGVSRAALLGLLLAAAGIAAIVLSGDDSPVPAAKDYKAMWEKPRKFPRPAPPFNRSRRSLDVAVVDGTCHPGPNSQRSIRRRFKGVRVKDRSDAVVITVVMRPEKRGSDDEICAGVGGGFNYRVRLKRPVGRRAVIGDFEREWGQKQTVYPSLDQRTQRRLERETLVPGAHEECKETPPGVLAEKYGGADDNAVKLVRLATDGVPRHARQAAYRACLRGLRDYGEPE